MCRILCGFFLLAVLATTLNADEVPDRYSVVEQEEDRGFRETALYYHNFYRKQRGLEPLQLDDRLNVLAHDHAERLSREKKLRTSGSFLQNLWSYRGTLRPLIWSAENSVKSWYEGTSPIINTISLVDDKILYSRDIKFLGFGVGAFRDYSVAVAYYV